MALPFTPTLSLRMTRNKTGAFFIDVFEADGVTPQSLVGSTLWFHAGVAQLGIELNKYSPSPNGITINNSAGGTDCATLQIEPGDTAFLPTTGTLSIPCELTLQNGSEDFELASGNLLVYPNVGTP